MEKRKRKSGRETEGKGSLCFKYVTESQYCKKFRILSDSRVK